MKLVFQVVERKTGTLYRRVYFRNPVQVDAKIVLAFVY